MLYWLGSLFADSWGPLRLFTSHLVLLAVGTLLGGVLVWRGLPATWALLPLDRGRPHTGKAGQESAQKPTGAGILLALLLLPVFALVMPPDPWLSGVLGSLYLAMFFGFADDSSANPWGEGIKGITDLLVAAIAALCLSRGQAVTLWLPVYKSAVTVPFWWYFPLATGLLWFTINATNCSDGVDGLAGGLTLLSLFSLAGLLYGVVGYRPIADYLLIPHAPDGARWAILVATLAGGLSGYLWHNAAPSRVLMGDAGSRLFGLAVGIAVLAAGNPFLVFVVAPVVLVNGGTGLFKIVLLRLLKRVGFDTTPPGKLTPEAAGQQHVIVRALHSVRFPLHDHCRNNLHWSGAQVLMRFILVQAFLTPLLFVLLVKIR